MGMPANNIAAAGAPAFSPAPRKERLSVQTTPAGKSNEVAVCLSHRLLAVSNLTGPTHVFCDSLCLAAGLQFVNLIQVLKHLLCFFLINDA